jgi:hypothetical protein
MAFTPSQSRQLGRRTTPSSRDRLADKLRTANQKTAKVGGSTNGSKPSLGVPSKSPYQKQKPSAAAKKPQGRSSQPDSHYYDSVDLAGRQEESRLGQLEGQETALKHEYGIEDPTNPMSRAEGLKRLYLQRFRGASAGIAASGHLYSGQHERALSRTRRDEEEARAGLRSQYEGVIGQLGAAKAGVKFETEEQRQQAFEDWLARAPESEADVENVGQGVAPVQRLAGPGQPGGPAPIGASPQLRGLFDPLAGRKTQTGKGGGKAPKKTVKKNRKGR